MSILAGIVHWTPEVRPPDDLRTMLSFPGRTPDGCMIRQAPGASVGIGRAITTTQQAQPDRDRERGDIIAVVDARLDHLADLRRDLGFGPDSSDADLAVAAYRRWGPGMVSRLRGEFAFMLWDPRRATLIAGRDPFGVRPLYFASAAERLLIASDPEQMFATGSIRPIPDDRSVVGHLLWEFPDLDRTFFKHVRRVPPGHLLTATAMGTSLSDYREVSLPDAGPSGATDCMEEFRGRFSTAVSRRLDAIGPTIVHLSGGVDSSSIVCLVDQIVAADPAISKGVLAAAAVYPGLASNEERFIAAVEAQVKVPVARWDGTAALPDELAAVQTWAPGGRFPWTGGTRGDFDLARSCGARVILNGTGGDQLGLPDGALPDAVVEGRWRDAARFLFRAPRSSVRSSVRRVLRLAKALGPGWAGEIHDAVRRRARQPPDWIVARAWKEWRPAAPARSPAPFLRTHLQRARWLDLTSARHAFSLEWVQQYALRNGVEARFPFLDWDLVTYALSIPAKHWPPPWPYERLHRKALAGVLPPLVEGRRTKANAADALANRVRKQLPAIQELIHRGPWHAEPYVHRAAALAVVARFQAARQPRFEATWAVWAIATLEAWLRVLSGYTAAPKREA